jgi:hypothetical protein
MKGTVNPVLQPAMYVGLGLVALWTYVRFPGRRPRSISHAFGHVVLSFALMLVLPVVLALVLAFLHGRGAVAVFLIGALMPSLGYLLLSWFWLLGRIVGDVDGGTPRGGHPVANASR